MALSTLALALSTDACAEAIVAAGSVELLDPDAPEPVEPDPAEPPPAEPPPPDREVVDELGVVVVAGAVVVVGLVSVVVVWVVVDGVVWVVLGVVVPVVGVVVVVVVCGVVVVGTALSSDTNSVVLEAGLVSRLVVTVLESDSALLSWSSAAVRF